MPYWRICSNSRLRLRGKPSLRFVGAAILALVAAASGQSPAPGDNAKSPAPPAAEAASPWMEEVVRKSLDSVVSITVEGRDGRQAGLGSGFVVASEGLIATNLHVIGEARPIMVRFRDGRELPVTEIYASDRQLDVAVIRVAADDLPALPLAEPSASIVQGQPIVALGHPMGLKHSVVSGVVSGEREIDGQPMIQIAMPIEPGNSGGPLLDARGRVLGIVTLKSAVTANLGFAQRADSLQTVLSTPNPVDIARWKTIGSLDQQQWSTVFGARWRQRSGQIVVSESGDSFGGRSLCLWNDDPPATTFEFGAFVRLDDESGAAGLAFAADGQNRHYGFYPTAGHLRLTRFNGPTVYSWEILEQLTSPHYRPGKWNHLKVRIEDQQITCFVNDQPVLNRPMADAATGKIGLAKFRDTTASFRQFQVAAQIDPTQLSPQRLAPIRERLAAMPLPQWPRDQLLEELSADSDASRQVLEEQAERMRQRAEQFMQLADDLHVRRTCEELVAVCSRPAREVSLAEAALLVARLDNHDLDVAAYRRQLDRMADEIQATLDDDASSDDRFAALNRYLFEQNGFHGSRTNYYQAANSYFDRVLDDREGLPITLSILYLELAERLKLTMEGVGLPGHFIVRLIGPDGESRLIDVFDGGRIISVDDAKRIAQQTSGMVVDPSHWQPVEARQIILRVLRNLQGLAQQRRDRDALLRYLEAIVSLEPDDAASRGLRALVRFETGRKQAAIDDLDWFLKHAPPGADLDAVRQLRERFTQ